MRIARLKLIVLLLPMMTGCLRHTRVSQQPEFSAPVPSPNVLQLVETINRRYDQISSLTATPSPYPTPTILIAIETLLTQLLVMERVSR